jgi:hypothetical protein
MISENKPVRLICKKTNFGPNKISDLRKESTGQSTNSKCTKAYQLFEEYEEQGTWDSRALLKVSIQLDVPSDQTLKFYKDYLTLKQHDRLRELHIKSEPEIDSLLALHEALKENQVSEEDYPFFIQKIKNAITLDKQVSNLNFAVKNAKSTLSWCNSKVTQAKNDCNYMDLLLQQKTQMVANANREYLELNQRNEKFRSLIELGHKNDIKPLILELVRERLDFDREKLLALVENLAEAVVRVIELYPDLAYRFATNNYTETDLNDLRVMLVTEADYYVDQRLDDPTRWRSTIPGNFPLDI